MKPSPFTYHRPESLEEALSVLGEVGGDGKVLAGGQSLIPLLSMRLAAPSHLVDINRLTELAFVRSDADGVRVGALARHAQVERDDKAAAAQPLLRQALRLVAHPVIRNRGTTVGSLAHADPSGEMTAVLTVLGGTVTIASSSARRIVNAADFFLGPLESAVAPGELAVEASFPSLPERSGTAFLEVARRHGDYAMCGVAAAVTVGADGAIAAARVCFISMGPVPELVDLTDAVGAETPSPGDAEHASSPLWLHAAAAAVERLDPEPDIHASADYRRQLGRTLTARALRDAYRSASRTASGSAPPDAPSAAARRPSTRHVEKTRLAEQTADASAPEQTIDVALTVNGVRREARVPSRRLLSDFLRHDLRLTGTHVGCEHGVCGACTVLVDDVPMRSCLMLAASADGMHLTTVEGLANDDGTLHPVQQAFRECHGLQCGFCTPGFLTTIAAYLEENPEPSEEEAREAISGNLCRCTGYQNIVKSVLRAAELRSPDSRDAERRSEEVRR